MDLSKALETGAYSDLTIKCGDDEYAVHKVVLCTQSKVLGAAISHDFKEGVSGTIDLSHDEPEHIARLLHFLYSSHYSCSVDHITTHATMYTLGDKYDIPKLREYAKNELQLKLSTSSSLRNFFQSIYIVYESTPENDRSLRNVVVMATRLRMERIVTNDTSKSDFADVVKNLPEFAVDLFTDIALKPEVVGCGKCGVQRAAVPSNSPRKRCHECRQVCG